MRCAECKPIHGQCPTCKTYQCNVCGKMGVIDDLCLVCLNDSVGLESPRIELNDREALRNEQNIAFEQALLADKPKATKPDEAPTIKELRALRVAVFDKKPGP